VDDKNKSASRSGLRWLESTLDLLAHLLSLPDAILMVPNKTAFSSAAKILNKKSRSALAQLEHQSAATLTSPTHQAKVAPLLGEREKLSDFPAVDVGSNGVLVPSIFGFEHQSTRIGLRASQQHSNFFTC